LLFSFWWLLINFSSHFFHNKVTETRGKNGKIIFQIRSNGKFKDC